MRRPRGRAQEARGQGKGQGQGQGGPPEEIVGRRGPFSKEFMRENNGRRTVHLTRPAHYRKNNKWEDLDLVPEDRGNRWQIDDAPYTLQVFKADARLFYQSNTLGTYEQSIVDFDGPLNVVPTVVTEPQVQIRFNDIRPGLDLIYEARAQGFRVIASFKDATAPSDLVFLVEETEERSFTDQARLYGWDSKYPNHPAKRPAEFTRVTGAPTPRPPDKQRYTLTKTFTGRASEMVDPVTRRREWQTDIVYPVTMYG